MTLPASLPLGFRTAARVFADTLHRNFSSSLAAQPEDQLKGPVQALLASVTSGVLTKTEVQVDALGGRPDIGVHVDNLLCGFVELKAPGTGAITRKFKSRDKVQWEKFKALHNLRYTDGLKWALYRFGVHQPEAAPVVIRINDLIDRGAVALDDETLAALHTLLLDFATFEPIAPSTPRALAEMLAPLCRYLRADVATAVAREGSKLRMLSAEIREYLFPHQTDEQFADIYAQTLTYALLLARLSGEKDLTAAHAADRLDSGHGLLAETLRILTQKPARAEIDTGVAILERVIGKVDPVKLGKRGDPWLYFYEDFLAAYDPELRRQHGVYYTPQEVIACQVALVSELLTDHFDKPLTFADEGVVFLDSSAGTAAYPLAAITDALARVKARLGQGAVAEFATRCAQNVYAFELLVGPYAVAHLRLTKLLADAGATLPADGLNVLLTDTLESPHVDPPVPPLMAERLTTEQRRARRVKAETPVFVCMGNPPYFREKNDDGSAKTRGKWVRFGDERLPGASAPPPPPILHDFTTPAGSHAKNLYNLYVYFWRWTLWKMFEHDHASRRGIVSFITASSFLRGPGFVGMRQCMREAFDELWIIDLEGDNFGARKTETVFAIETPVCIATGIRHAAQKRHLLARVRYTRVTGTREEKLAKLKAIRALGDVTWEACFNGAVQPFLPERAGDYFAWSLLTDLWPWQGCGVKYERNWPVAETREVLAERWRLLLAAPLEEKRKLFREDDDRKVSKQYTGLRPPRDRLREISKLASGTEPLEIARFGFRTLDRHYALADNHVGGRMNPSLWSAHGDKQVYLTSLLTGVLGIGPAATATAHVPDLHHFCGRGGKDVIPLWRDAAATQPNLPAGLLATLGAALGIPVNAEDFFAYTYAMLSAPAYVETFSEELTLPGPHLPVTRDSALFARAVTHGRHLLWLHSYGERIVPDRQKTRASARRRGEMPSGRAHHRRRLPRGFRLDGGPDAGG